MFNFYKDYMKIKEKEKEKHIKILRLMRLNTEYNLKHRW